MKKYILLICLLATQLISLMAQNDSIKARQNGWGELTPDQKKRYLEIMAEERQRDSITREDVLNNAEFVFEAVVKKIDYYPRIDSDGLKRLGISWILKVTKVFRGNLKPGTVEMVGESGNGVGIQQQRETDNQQRDTLFIFFCRVANEYPYNPKYNIYPVDNKTILAIYSKEASDSYDRIDVNLRQGFNKRFASKGDIYRYIAKYPNVKIPVLTKEDTTFVIKEMYPVIPGKPHGISKAKSDSLQAIRRAKLLEDAKREYRLKQDSINAEEKAKSDSIKAIRRAKMLKDIKIHNQLRQAKSDSLKAAGHDKLLEEKKRYNQQLISPGLIV